jgi:hypothetical protein
VTRRAEKGDAPWAMLGAIREIRGEVVVVHTQVTAYDAGEATILPHLPRDGVGYIARKTVLVRVCHA